MTRLLDIRGLRIEAQSREGRTEIVKGVDLNLDRGEILGLIGESGAGKSTLGLAAMGHVKPGCRITGGSIRFDGLELAGADARLLRQVQGRRIAYVAQSSAAAFNPAWRLIAQYCEGPVQHRLMPRAQAEAEAVSLYREMRLPDPERIGARYPHQVSGGQLQRAMTAMSMSCHPELLIFDEPTTALDVTTQIEVLAAIREVVRRHDAAAIYITHDLAVVAQMADRIKVLLKGEEVEEAPTREMLAAPREEYTRSLWAVRNFQPAPRDEPAPPEPILHIQGVSASYGVHPVLRDVSISVPRGRTVAVVGESGSGKSTTARVVMGLLPPSAGQVVFDGQVLDPLSRNRPRTLQRRLQMIHQMADTALNPRHRVREILGRPLEFFLGLRGRKKEDRIRDLLDQIELEPGRFIDRLPGELSGGQKQRLCIARALAAEPELIICDEVTSALDQLVAEGILRLLDRLQREMGLSYLFITHDLATVRSIADEVVVMQNGAVVEQGPKAQMFQPPHHPYTEKLLSSVPEMDPDWLTRLLGQRQMQEKGAA
ncbi:ABC transporter ATP-binding protein [Paracoccus versutus]|uniref:Peptide/nickel transport system ATP-binding protein n=1 Tax=Paracoccus versutus TaxID=34007 RepID=A0AAQ0HI97_PARVE|nr:ABC transporter ATP-binding protein [Paracoccus versutus]KGJ11989.1 ABC transporter [Paracoccus versutus]REG46454.1 peptide/nickel transport system ATP-binding protein [Paracoccus versutus]WEJ78513.1 ABC transporter ATP-binding protein [Paracoccus versutus]